MCHLKCFMCGTSHCQHSAAPPLPRRTVNVAPSLYKMGYKNVCVLRRQKNEYHLGCRGEMRYIVMCVRMIMEVINCRLDYKQFVL
jgi:hypothetical protein